MKREKKDWAEMACRLAGMAADMPIEGPVAFSEMLALSVALRQAEAMAWRLYEMEKAQAGES